MESIFRTVRLCAASSSRWGFSVHLREGVLRRMRAMVAEETIRSGVLAEVVIGGLR